MVDSMIQIASWVVSALAAAHDACLCRRVLVLAFSQEVAQLDALGRREHSITLDFWVSDFGSVPTFGHELYI